MHSEVDKFMKKKFIRKRKLCFIMAMIMICLSACSEEIEYVPEPVKEEIEQEKETTQIQQPVQSESEEKSEEEILEEFSEYLEEITKEAEDTRETHSEAEQVRADGFDREKAQQAFSKVNEQRAANEVAQLVWDEALYELACTRAQEIVIQFSHQRPDGSYVGDVMLNQYGATGCGENIASNYKSITNLINGWLNSEGHKENMLDDRFTAGVMACYYYDGSYYWVNLFKR